MTSLTAILEQVQAQSAPEAVAVLAAIAYLGLAIRQNIWCWLFAGISTAIYVGLFIDAKLYMESALNAFYLVMAGYGWSVWRSGHGDEQPRPVVIWPMRVHVSAIAGIVALSVINGYLLSTHSDAVFPYVDSLITWFAIWGTFLLAHKVLENWWYWLVIDIASAFIYWLRDLQLTSLLFVVYVIMIPFGLIRWTKSMQEQAE